MKSPKSDEEVVVSLTDVKQKEYLNKSGLDMINEDDGSQSRSPKSDK